MFTGLVADLGTIDAVDATDDGVRLTVSTPLAGDLVAGDSIAVNGVCLTAVAIVGSRFQTAVMHETLSRSSLAAITAGTRVNLELALRAADRLGGHIMQGHVDGVGTVADVRDDGFARIVTIAAGPRILRYVVEKGSIAVDGVSLTVARIDDEGFDVSLIPETLERTSLGEAAPGDRVNLEADVLAKYVEKLLGSAVKDVYASRDLENLRRDWTV
jgi:riboflavin synthase